MRRAAEAAVVALAGGALGAAAGATVGWVVDAPLTLAAVGAGVAGTNGALCGHRRVYDWWSPRGVVAFGLDSTWALATTAGGVVAQLVGRLQGGRAGYVRSLSERQNRVVHRRGLVVRRGFAITFGNVVNGAGDVDRPRRRKLVTDHEDVHVWQARWFGPLYPLAYGGWMVAGGAVGALLWTVRRSPAPLWRTIDTCAYHLNPFEWWAYSRDDHWPPGGAVPTLAWPRPIVRPLVDRRRFSGRRAGAAARR